MVHRKDGQTHKKFSLMGLPEYTRELMTGAYVRVCFRCHKSVHWCMEHLNLTWEDIKELRIGTQVA